MASFLSTLGPRQQILAIVQAKWLASTMNPQLFSKHSLYSFINTKMIRANKAHDLTLLKTRLDGIVARCFDHYTVTATKAMECQF